jgi:hypothetical protein
MTATNSYVLTRIVHGDNVDDTNVLQSNGLNDDEVLLGNIELKDLDWFAE